jgi:hypothetical protein
MLRLIVIACILITSTHANAVNWKEVAKSEDLIATYYVDSQSIKRVGKFLYVTEMVDYSELQSTSSNNWKSDISIVRYDCAKTNSLLMALKLYGENKARGKPLASYKDGNEKDTKLIASDTVGALVYDYVCHTKIY